MHKKIVGGRFLAYQLVSMFEQNQMFVQKVGTDMPPPIIEVLGRAVIDDKARRQEVQVVE